jgi:hypothetical protein
MRAASRTEFLDRKFVGLRLLILAGRVVARLAGVARKRNQISHCNTPRKKYPSRKKPSRKIPAPLNRRSKIGAHDGIRTRDLFLTKEVLYRLSYMGLRCAAQPESLSQKRFAKIAASNHRQNSGAGDGTRTRDPELGRLALYQLSYSRSSRRSKYHTGGEGRIRTFEVIRRQIYSLLPLSTREPLPPKAKNADQADGENRTRNHLITNQVLYR